MSSLGYVIAFLACNPLYDSCDVAAIRASKFLSLAECEANIPEVMRAGANSRPSSLLRPTCRSLDELCAARLNGAVSLRAAPRLVRTAVPPSRGGVRAALDLLCEPAPRDGC